jgi:hypothetical protein
MRTVSPTLFNTDPGSAGQSNSDEATSADGGTTTATEVRPATNPERPKPEPESKPETEGTNDVELVRSVEVTEEE